jgi:hypothetical protein
MELTDEEIMAKDIGKLSREEFERFRNLEQPVENKKSKNQKKLDIDNSKLTERDILLKILDRLEDVSEAMNNLVSMAETEAEWQMKLRVDPENYLGRWGNK